VIYVVIPIDPERPRKIFSTATDLLATRTRQSLRPLRKMTDGHTRRINLIPSLTRILMPLTHHNRTRLHIITLYNEVLVMHPNSRITNISAIRWPGLKRALEMVACMGEISLPKSPTVRTAQLGTGGA